MSDLLIRTEIKYLHEWSAQRPLKPVIIRGARQVGKSTLVREFAREARFSLVELNFERNPELRKAGTSGSLRSVHQFLKEKRSDFALRFNADVPSLLRDSKGLPDGTRIDYHLLSLPLYMVGQARRLVVEFESR